MDGGKVPTGQQWAEVCFVPNPDESGQEEPRSRCLGTIREPLREVPLPGMEGQLDLPFPAMDVGNPLGGGFGAPRVY